MFKYFKKFLPQPIYKKKSFFLTNLFSVLSRTIRVPSPKFAKSRVTLQEIKVYPQINLYVSDINPKCVVRGFKIYFAKILS